MTTKKLLMMNVLYHLIRLMLLMLFIGLGILVTLTLPLSIGSDEVAHFEFGRFIAKHDRLPITFEERTEAGYKSDLPPLYHLQFGLLGSWVDLSSPPYIKFIINNSRLQLVSGIRTINTWRTLHTIDPLESEYLLWYFGRWLTLANSVICLILIYYTILTVWPEDTWLTLAGTAFLASVSTYFKNSFVITYEPFLGLWMAAYFLLLFHTLKQPEKRLNYLGLGVLLGLAASTKYTPVPVILLLCIVIVWLARCHRWSVTKTATRLVLMLTGIGITFGSWLIFTVVYFNQIQEHGLLMGVLRTFLASDESDRTSLRLVYFLSGGTQGMDKTLHHDTLLDWIRYLLNDLFGNHWLVRFMVLLLPMAILGGSVQWRKTNAFTQLWTTVLGAHIVFLLILPFVRFVMTQEASSGSGRHLLFPAAVPLLLLLIYGLKKWFSSSILGLIFLFLLSSSLYQNYYEYQHDLTSPFPVQTIPLPHETLLVEYEEMTLVDFNVATNSKQLTTELWWRVDQFINQDYQLQLTVVDNLGVPQARWRGQPLDGRYPTRAWFPHDRIRTTIPIPIVGVPAGQYSLQFHLLTENGNPITPLNQADEILTKVLLQPAPFSPLDYHLIVDGKKIGYTVWQSQSPLREWATVIVAIEPALPSDISLYLSGPDNRKYAPLDHVGQQFIFQFAPPFVKGQYAVELFNITGYPILNFIPERRKFTLEAVSNEIGANFADYLTLLGYDLPERIASPAQPFRLTLHWQARQTIPADLVFFIHLIGPDGKRWAYQERMTHDLYSTMLWVPHEIVSDSFALSVDPQAPAGDYQLLVGVYLPVGEAVSLPLVEDGNYTELTHVNLGVVRVE